MGVTAQSLVGRQPWPLRAFNALGPGLDRVGVLPRLRVDALVEAARRQTGLYDFGDEWFREPLAVLVESLETEARLSALGRTIMRSRLVGALVNRLRAEALFRAHPQILERPISPVLVIAGLQRTGTTVLHRLLAADPRLRAMLSWEAINPAPLPGDEPGPDGRPRARVRQARIAQKALQLISPQFFAIHPVEYDQPEEDVLLLDISFMSQSAEATMRVPSYARWLEQADHRPAYRYLRRLMQLLLWQRPAPGWVLKSPHHMEYLDVVLEVFAEATVIQTHRDPRKTMPSFCSMVCHGASIFSESVDVSELSAHWTRKVGRMIERSGAVRQAADPDRFIDVSYYDLLHDPIAQIRRIYARCGLELDTSVEQAMQRQRRHQVRHKHGRHDYRLVDFGLSDARIEQQFGAYRERYAIPVEDPRTADEPKGAGAAARDDGRPNAVGHNDPLRAIVTGVVDLLRREDQLVPIGPDERVEGKTALVTGANSGLGKAVAIELARRGAHVLMACRNGHPEAGQEVRRASGSDRVEMLRVDLADLEQVNALCDQLRDRLRDRAQRVDIAVLNAGLMPARARRTPQGFEVMFAVHFLANRLLLRRWVDDGVLQPSAEPSRRPRVVLVSSETHRSARPIDFEGLGEFVDYGIRNGLAEYGYSKLHLSTFAVELSRRLNGHEPGGSGVAVGVHCLCPGPIASNIARDAPAWLQPVVPPLLRLLFRSPERAAEPVVLLAAGQAMEGRTGLYLHMMREKPASPLATDPDNGARLWEASEALIAPYLR